MNGKFQLVGLISDDGMKETVDRKTEDIKDWSGSIVRTVQSEYSLKLKLTFIERTDQTLKEVFGQDNVKIQDTRAGRARTILYNEKMLEARCFVIELQDGKNQIRKVYPNAQVTDVGDTKYVTKDVISYEVTITAYKDERDQFQYEYDLASDVVAGS
ncbi:phage tail tube protein [Rothia koreensis]|uniref:phage tail tube protein n=1 Tax=Rothia koreensis TaxID=592378 RepID=UPI003FCD160B